MTLHFFTVWFFVAAMQPWCRCDDESRVWSRTRSGTFRRRNWWPPPRSPTLNWRWSTSARRSRRPISRNTRSGCPSSAPYDVVRFPQNVNSWTIFYSCAVIYGAVLGAVLHWALFIHDILYLCHSKGGGSNSTQYLFEMALGIYQTFLG